MADHRVSGCLRMRLHTKCGVIPDILWQTYGVSGCLRMRLHTKCGVMAPCGMWSLIINII
ncbi:MAG: hypothetical protein NC240_02055 [Clostridium sp.]|nr:hypothetical protein [Clostridium sp.]